MDAETMRAVFVQIQQTIDNAQAASDQRVRIYRNVLVIAILILVAAAIILPIVIPELAPDSITLRRVQDGSTAPAPTGRGIAIDVIAIEVWGTLGGLVGLIVALRRLNSSRHPARLQLFQLLLKLPAGAITAVFGVVFFQAGIIPSIQAASVGQLAAYAVLFGFAQEAATALVDRQANRLLEQAKTIDSIAPNEA